MVAVQLPGRENRFAETPCTHVEQAIDDLDAERDALLDGASELTLFGHSLGAVLAYGDLPMRELYVRQTVRGVAAYLVEMRSGRQSR